ncbi:MAG: SusD/RagB family nutrient-binding outer membrane lipoprotein [Bacteroidota bacterium]
MKNTLLKTGLLAVMVILLVGCKKFLNINSDPDTPQAPSNSSVLPAMISGIPRGVQYDARYMGKYTQNWLTSTVNNADTWDRMGYVGNSDNSGDIWRQTYFGLGGNLEYIIKNGIDKKEFDYTAAALTLKALMFQMAADYHGQIIFNEAFVEGKYYFKFQRQDTVYAGIDSLCRKAIEYYDMAASNPVTLGRGDISYGGDLTKWRKLTYAILAKNFHRYSNKLNGVYKADSVIKYCDLAMTSVADDFLVPFDASKNDDSNFWGTYRNNLSLFRQSNFIVKLLDGTTFSGTTEFAKRDPRLRHMLSASEDTANGNGGYRGVEPGVGDQFSALTAVYAVGSTNWINARKRVAAPWGDSLYANPSASVFGLNYGKYLFKDKAVMPVICFTEMQFIKAEAAFIKGNKPLAYTAYLAGINAHFDFINRTTFPRSNATLFNGSVITAGQRTAYLASTNVKASSDVLTVSDIMLQKYIALWGWGWVETWVDLRRYHYNADIDPTTMLPVYKNFALPTTIFASNLGKPVYRVRPRYNSEYVWNLGELSQGYIGGNLINYHTFETWFSIRE